MLDIKAKYLGRAIRVGLMITVIGCLDNVFGQTTAQTTFYFPQVAVGQNADGTQYLTYVALTNPSASVASGKFQFRRDNGSALSVSSSNLITGLSSADDTVFFST